MTTEQWFAHPELRKSLVAILADPVMVDALHIIRDMEMAPVTHTAGDLVQYYALMGAKRIGYLEFIKNLEFLSKVHRKPTTEPKAWEPSQPDKINA